MPQLQLPGVVFKVLFTAAAARRFLLLRHADPHPWGLAAPSLDPVMLAGHSWDLRGLTTITLACGDPLEASAPLVEIPPACPAGPGMSTPPRKRRSRIWWT